MQQLAALLSSSPAETLDQIRRQYDETPSADSDYNELIQDGSSDLEMTSKPLPASPPSSHVCTSDSSVTNSSFSIENILSPSPRCHGDHQQHQQQHRITDESHNSYQNGTLTSAVQILPALPLSRAFYGQCYCWLIEYTIMVLLAVINHLLEII